jgi:hypothetical protein
MYPSYADTVFVMNYGGALGAADSNNVNYPANGAYVDVIGEVHYDGTNGFRVCPRSAADITINPRAGAVAPAVKTLSFSVHPNPSRSPSLAFTLPVATHVDLGVFDVTGRRVVTLASGTLPAAEYSRQWNGRDASGNAVGAGVYFYRLTAGSETRIVRSIVLGN